MNRFKSLFFSLFLSGIFILMFSGIAFASDSTINSDSTLTADQTVDGNLILDHATLNLDNHQLTVNGDLVMCAGEDYVEDTLLDIAGGTLNVTGNLILETGELKVNSGNIHVGGDFRVQSRNMSGGNYVYGASKGWMRMESPGGTIDVNGSFYIDSINYGYLDAGTINIKGNFTQKSSTSDCRTDSFNATEGHKVVLCGTGEQDVSFDDPTESGFGMLDIINGTTRDIVFKTPVRGWTLNQDLKVKGDLGLASKWMSLNEHNLTVTGDVAVTSDYGGLDIAGGSLDVTGSLIHQSGELKLDSGEIHVGGDFRVQSRTKSGVSYVYGTSKGWLRMESPGGTINLDGSFFMDSTNYGYIDAGTMNIKGNFTQKSSTSDCRADSFNATEGHKVVLCGTGEQDVSFEDPTESGFGMLDILNGTTRDIVFKTPVRGWALNQDLIVKGDLGLADKQMSLNKHNLTVTGDVIVNSGDYGALDIDEGTLDVKGNLIHQNGELKVNSGRVHINGDFRMQSRAASGGNYVYGTSNGWLTMQTPGGTIDLDGSFFVDSTNYGSLDAGTMNIKRNFTQQSSTSASRADCFNATEGHKVALCGKGEQDVSFDDPTESGFGTLEIDNSMKNIKFLTEYTYKAIINNGTAVITDFTANPSSVTIITGKTQAVKVTVTYDNGKTQDVTKSPLTTWESEDPDVATVTGGVITGESQGETVVTASYSGQIIEIPVKVAPVVKSISADPASLNMAVGGDDVTPPIITAHYGSYDGDEDVTELVTWTSSKPDIVNIVNSDEGVMFHANAKGATKLTATYCGKTTTINVKVTSEVTGLAAIPSTVTLTTGKKQAVKVYVDYADGSKEDITKSKSATWESADTDVATVSGGSIKGVGKGETTITVSYNDQSIDIPVTVTPVVKSISADPADPIEMTVGDEADPPAIIAHYVGGGEDEDVTELTTWKSSKPQIVEVVNGDNGVTFNAKAKGTAKITAIYNGKKTTVTVIVS